MKIFKTVLPTFDGIHEVDTIEYENEYWLVPIWLENTALKKIMPERMIPLRVFSCRDTGVNQRVRFEISDPVAGEIFDDVLLPEIAKAYCVVVRPQIAFDVPAEFVLH